MTRLHEIDILDVGNSIQLTGAIYSGQDAYYLCFFPGDQPDGLRLDELQMDLADWQKFLRQTDLMETEILVHAKDKTVTKAIVRKSQRQIDQVVSWKVFKRDNYSCRYCASDDTPLTVDHLIAWEDGGPTIEENLHSRPADDRGLLLAAGSIRP